MVKISAVIITYNEERNIQRCLDSLVGVVDEIVVVDSFSKDNTAEICKKAGAKFIQNPFKGHIEQKNFAITQASYPHILSLDADEALTKELATSIGIVKQNFTADAYQLNRLTNYCGKWIKHCGWYPDKKLRLWDSRKGAWGGVNPHDKYIMQEGSKIDNLKGDLLHYSFYSIQQHVGQVNYFSEIAANALFEKGKKVSVFYIMISPIAKFLRDYVWKRGFMDGYYGLVISVISSYAKFLKYAKLRSLHISKTSK